MTMDGTIGIAGFDYVRNLVYERSHIVLEPGKEYLVESRLAPIARETGAGTIDALVTLLRANPSGDIAERVIDAMTTNETSFFRDLKPFDALRKHLLPEIMKRRADSRTLHIWSGAASSGQEAYTIAMTIREYFPELLSWNLSIVGTDLSGAMVRQAKEGKYTQLEINRGLPATMMVKYFLRDGTAWQVKPELRAMVEFRQMNLIGPWAGIPRMDIVFLRNVLIYFDRDTKKRIFERLRGLLREDGYLLLGSAESPLNFVDTFERMAEDAGGAYRPVGKPGGRG